MKKHPSHVTRSSDASTFDEVCVNCGATDNVPGGWGDLAKPCQSKEQRAAKKRDEFIGSAKQRAAKKRDEEIGQGQRAANERDKLTVTKPKRWQDDAAFVGWLKNNQYDCVSDGVVIYMWEAFCAGRDLLDFAKIEG